MMPKKYKNIEIHQITNIIQDLVTEYNKDRNFENISIRSKDGMEKHNNPTRKLRE